MTREATRYLLALSSHRFPLLRCHGLHCLRSVADNHLSYHPEIRKNRRNDHTADTIISRTRTQRHAHTRARDHTGTRPHRRAHIQVDASLQTKRTLSPDPQCLDSTGSRKLCRPVCAASSEVASPLCPTWRHPAERESAKAPTADKPRNTTQLGSQTQNVPKKERKKKTENRFVSPKVYGPSGCRIGFPAVD